MDVGYFIPERELDNYEEDERVRYEKGEQKGQLRKYEEGTFIYRLAGREREKSASYYTPEVLTKCLVKYALKELLKNKTADEILNLTICEPAMGSAAFLNEAINQLAESYLHKKQEELGETISYDQRFEELQKVKMFIADRNVYGVDLNPIAVELAEVSLWLNTIYKGAYVPWFGTQLVCGNSLIGARRQVYSQFRLEVGKWWENAPTRIMPGETRTRKGQHETTKGIYHFLLGDPGMANYTDKVIKGLEPDNIKTINNWRKEFTAKYDENDIQTLLSLSESIDDLWSRTVELRKKVKEATFEPLSVFGHDESEAGSHTTIREKDEIYKKLFKSEHMNNAGPYARLKAAMDYWCALWFWPIDKADLLPDRQTFFFEMSLLLEGTLNAVSTNASGQMSFVDSSGNASYDEAGNLNYIVEGSQIALEFRSQYATLGRVNLDELRAKHERLAIVNQIAEQQRFQHWELEFADVFEDNGGFDLVIGNPPWIKYDWNEQHLLSEIQPQFAIKSYNAADVNRERNTLFAIRPFAKNDYYDEYQAVVGVQSFIGSKMNYDIIGGQQTNLYKPFLPLAWEVSKKYGVSAFVHPDGIYDDPKAGELRKEMYCRLCIHFQFRNELKLFADVHHSRIYSLNVYKNGKIEIAFDSINNLYAVDTIEQCYEPSEREVLGIKNDIGGWNTEGHPDRVIHYTENELKVIANLFNEKKWSGVQLLTLHTIQFLETIRCISLQKNCFQNFIKEVYCSEMWNETSAQKDGIIEKSSTSPTKPLEVILSGANIGLSNLFFKSANTICEKNSDYENIDLLEISGEYLPRGKYQPVDAGMYVNQVPETGWGSKYIDEYRIFARKMIDPEGYRTLLPCLAPPLFGHTHGVTGMAFRNKDFMVYVLGLFSSLPYDFIVKVTGKANFQIGTISIFPIPKNNNEIFQMIVIRTMRLNCITCLYSELWHEIFEKLPLTDDWSVNNKILSQNSYENVSNEWNMYCPIKDDYSRRMALVEIDVLVAMLLGMNLEQLKTIYRVQFPILKSQEDNTWYDSKGRIVFTNNRSLVGVGISHQEFLKVQEMKTGEICSNNNVYYAPFVRCDREKDYEKVWDKFENSIRKVLLIM